MNPVRKPEPKKQHRSDTHRMVRDAFKLWQAKRGEVETPRFNRWSKYRNTPR